MTEEEEKAIIERVESKPFQSWISLQSWFRIKFPDRNWTPSTWLLRKVCEENNLRKRVSKLRKFVSTINKRIRLDWAEEKKDWGYKEWKRVVFSDEKCSTSSCHHKRWVIRPSGTRNDEKYTSDDHHSGRISIHYHAFITSEGLGDIELFNPGSNDGEQLIRITRESLKKDRGTNK